MREQIVARCARARAVSCVAERPASPARRATPARSPRGSSTRHPALRARGRDEPRRTPGAARRALPAPPRRRRARGARPRPPRPTSTPRSSPTRTARPRRSSPRCASAASRSSTSARTSGCATARPTRRWYVPHTAPELLGEAVYGLPELLPRRDRAAPTSSPGPGCFPTAALLALAPLAPLPRRRRHRREDRRSAAPAAPPTATHALRRGRRERRRPTRSAPPPHAGDRPGARARRRARSSRDVRAAPACRSTRASSSPAT